MRRFSKIFFYSSFSIRPSKWGFVSFIDNKSIIRNFANMTGEFYEIREEFHSHELNWHKYLISSVGSFCNETVPERGLSIGYLCTSCFSMLISKANLIEGVFGCFG